MTTRGRAVWTLTVAVAASTLAFAGPSAAQIFPTSTTTTRPPGATTTAPPPTTTTSKPGVTSTTVGPTTTTTAPSTPPTTSRPGPTLTAPPGSSTSTTAPGSSGGTATTTPPAPGDESGGDGDGGTDGDARTVPPEAQRIINSVKRSGPNSSQALLDSVQELVALGLTPDEAIRVGFGRFPVAGSASFVHDWLYPRYGPGFRFHLGTDVFAPYGTPLRAPVDGTVTSGTSSLGGLYVKVFMPDGTYFYLAHMSGLVDGFVQDMPVKTGDIVGFVGDSGNAKGGAPHVHVGVYPRGGPATDPKPILDKFLADATAQLPQIVEQVRSARTPTGPAELTLPDPATGTPRGLLATTLLRALTSGPLSAVIPTETLYRAAGNPATAGLGVAEVEAEQLAAAVDWEAQQFLDQVRSQLLLRSEELTRIALGPFVVDADADAVVDAVVYRTPG